MREPLIYFAWVRVYYK